MKIHMDYLEGKVEEYDNVKVQWEHERRQLAKKIAMIEEKAKERAEQMDVELNRVKDEMSKKLAEAEQKAREAKKMYRGNT